MAVEEENMFEIDTFIMKPVSALATFKPLSSDLQTQFVSELRGSDFKRTHSAQNSMYGLGIAQPLRYSLYSADLLDLQ